MLSLPKHFYRNNNSNRFNEAAEMFRLRGRQMGMTGWFNMKGCAELLQSSTATIAAKFARHQRLIRHLFPSCPTL